MGGLTRQAAIVTISRLINQGLMIVSPVILVRLLSVDDFGKYREFLLYATVVGNFAAFSLPNSLLYYVGLQPRGVWGYVNRIALSLAVSSTIAVVVFAAIDTLLPKPLLGDALLPCVLYVLFCTNLDFWEFLWLAQRKSMLVVAYTASRLIVRIVLVTVVAFLTRDVATIIGSLVVLEGIRLLGALYLWRRLIRGQEVVPLEASWRDQLWFCIPSGIGVCVSTLNSSLGGMFVGQSIGEAALAQFVIGGYVLMVLSPLRNSVSDVLLPQMAALAKDGSAAWLAVWQRSVVLFAIILFPVAVITFRYAEPLVVTAFSEKYRDAASILQWHCAMILISCFDVALALRAIGKTQPLLAAIAVCLVVNLGLLPFLLPRYGTDGAAAALLASNSAGTVYLVWHIARQLKISVLEFIPSRRLCQVILASALAFGVITPSFWTDWLGVFGAVPAALLYLLVFFGILHFMRVPELGDLVSRVGDLVGRQAARA